MLLTATQSFIHGRAYRRGERIEASDRTAHELIRRGLARAPSAQADLSQLAFAILASGPSLTVEDCDAVRAWRDADPASRRVVAINTTYQRAPWADVFYACDAKWWSAHAEATAGLSGQRWTQSDEAARRYGLQLVRGKNGAGLAPSGSDSIHLGGNSGYQAIGLSVLMGAKRIVLLGFDMQATAGLSHWHGDHPWAKKGANPPFRAWIPRFAKLAADLASEGVEVVNATRATALRCFPVAPLESALC